MTAEEWLTAHRAAQYEDDLHREITDDVDLADVTAERDADVTAGIVEPHPDAAETGTADVRELTALEEAPADEEIVRVPTADETADTIRRAQRALVEIAQRRAADKIADANTARAGQLNRWHADDRAAEDNAVQRGRTLEISGPLG